MFTCTEVRQLSDNEGAPDSWQEEKENGVSGKAGAPWLSSGTRGENSPKAN